MEREDVGNIIDSGPLREFSSAATASKGTLTEGNVSPLASSPLIIKFPK